jgi:hypothetical protein
MANGKNPFKEEFVIIRARGDEPVRLRAVAVRGKAVDVVGSDESTPMPFHLEKAYHFDRDLFGNLRAAYEGGEAQKLAVLWERAVPLDRRGRTRGSG